MEYEELKTGQDGTCTDSDLSEPVCVSKDPPISPLPFGGDKYSTVSEVNQPESHREQNMESMSYSRQVVMEHKGFRKGDEKIFRCTVDGCEAIYERPQHVLEHARKHHGINVDEEEVMRLAPSCESCGKKLRSGHSLLAHTLSCKRRSQVTNPISQPTEDKYNCLTSDSYVYPCDICGRHLFSEATFDYHMRSIHQKRDCSTRSIPISVTDVAIQSPNCSICGKRFGIWNHVYRHVEKVHGGYAPIRESHEGSLLVAEAPSLSSSELLPGDQSYLEIGIESNERGDSDIVLARESRLRSKRKTVSGNDGALYPCANCNRIYKKQGRMEEHIIKVHKRNATAVELSGKPPDQVTYTGPKCRKCRKTFIKWDSLSQHILADRCKTPSIHTASGNLEKNKAQDQVTDRDDLLEDSVKCFPCSMCVRVLSTRKGLVNHVSRTHNRQLSEGESHGQACGTIAIPQPVCEICSKKYMSWGKLREHIIYHHYERQRTISYYCLECRKKLPSLEALNRHTKMYHMEHNNKEHLFPCKYCGNVLHSPKKAVLHMKLVHHSEERISPKPSCEVSIPTPSCMWCSTSYSRWKSVYMHMEVCSKAPNGKLNSKRQQKSQSIQRHVVYPCHLCGKVLNLRQSAESHLRKVHNKRKSQDSIRPQPAHTIKHSGPVCIHCNASFDHWTDLYRHMHSVHQEINAKEEQKIIYSSRSSGDSEGVEAEKVDYVYPCSICGRNLSELMSLESHLKRVHQVKGSNIVLEGIPKHLAKEPSPKCKKCGEEFDSWNALYNHLKKDGWGQENHNVLTATHFFCALCKLAFKDQQNLDRHNRRNHKPQDVSKSLNPNHPIHSRKKVYSTKTKKFRSKIACALCDRQFVYEGDWYRHLKASHRISQHMRWQMRQKLRQKNMNIDMELKEIVRPIDKPVDNIQCTSVHPPVATAIPRLFCCHICNVKTRYKIGLKNHYSTVHGISYDDIDVTHFNQLPSAQPHLNGAITKELRVMLTDVVHTNIMCTATLDYDSDSSIYDSSASEHSYNIPTVSTSSESSSEDDCSHSLYLSTQPGNQSSNRKPATENISGIIYNTDSQCSTTKVSHHPISQIIDVTDEAVVENVSAEEIGESLLHSPYTTDRGSGKVVRCEKSKEAFEANCGSAIFTKKTSKLPLPIAVLKPFSSVPEDVMDHRSLAQSVATQQQHANHTNNSTQDLDLVLAGFNTRLSVRATDTSGYSIINNVTPAGHQDSLLRTLLETVSDQITDAQNMSGEPLCALTKLESSTHTTLAPSLNPPQQQDKAASYPVFVVNTKELIVPSKYNNKLIYRRITFSVPNNLIHWLITKWYSDLRQCSWRVVALLPSPLLYVDQLHSLVIWCLNQRICSLPYGTSKIPRIRSSQWSLNPDIFIVTSYDTPKFVAVCCLCGEVVSSKHGAAHAASRHPLPDSCNCGNEAELVHECGYIDVHFIHLSTPSSRYSKPFNCKELQSVQPEKVKQRHTDRKKRGESDSKTVTSKIPKIQSLQPDINTSETENGNKITPVVEAKKDAAAGLSSSNKCDVKNSKQKVDDETCRSPSVVQNSEKIIKSLVPNFAPSVEGMAGDFQQLVDHYMSEYDCAFCDVSFPLRLQWEQHMSTLHKKCTLCDEHLESRQTRSDHISDVHNHHICLACDYTCDTEEEITTHVLSDHVDSSTGLFKCLQCNGLLIDPDEIAEHLEEDDSNNHRICLICQKELPKEAASNGSHFLTHALPGCDYVCRKCNVIFAEPWALCRHFITSEHSACLHCLLTPVKSSCNQCTATSELNKAVRVSAQKWKDSVSQTKQTSCTLCWQSCESYSVLRDHCDTQHRTCEHQCEICGQRFAFSHQYSYHMSKHPKISQYSMCSKCLIISHSIVKRSKDSVTSLYVTTTCQACSSATPIRTSSRATRIAASGKIYSFDIPKHIHLLRPQVIDQSQVSHGECTSKPQKRTSSYSKFSESRKSVATDKPSHPTDKSETVGHVSDPQAKTVGHVSDCLSKSDTEVHVSDSPAKTETAGYVSDSSDKTETEGHVSESPAKTETAGHVSDSSDKTETEGHVSDSPAKTETAGHVSDSSDKTETEGHVSDSPAKTETAGHVSDSSDKTETEGHISNCPAKSETVGHVRDSPAETEGHVSDLTLDGYSSSATDRQRISEPTDVLVEPCDQTSLLTPPHMKYRCDICTYATNFSSVMQRHKATIHPTWDAVHS